MADGLPDGGRSEMSTKFVSSPDRHSDLFKTTTEQVDSLDNLSINTIRTLSIDAVQQAKSGHPGTPMALAPVIYTLWQRFLRFDPDSPIWPNRDRFVLSNGHASMLLYAMLHLAEVKTVDRNNQVLDRPAVTLDDIKRFRQLDGRCPGHPEYGVTTGVETTTGPLGQGCGDSDMMEGVSSEAASLAGHLGLGNLCWIYDSNRITIEGKTDLAFSEDVLTRFRAYGWTVRKVSSANDTEQLVRSLQAFKHGNNAPTLIIVDSHIGFGAPHKQDTSEAHGEPLGEEEVCLAKRSYGWPENAKFLVPEGVAAHVHGALAKRCRPLRQSWFKQLAAYSDKFPDLADELNCMLRHALPRGWDAELPTFPPDAKGIASREASGKVLNAFAKYYPWFLAGSADLAP